MVNYQPQQKLLIQIINADEGFISVKPMRQLVEELAGSVKIPKKFRGMNIDKMIELAKLKHFSNFK
jgi:hypothetical protein